MAINEVGCVLGVRSLSKSLRKVWWIVDIISLFGYSSSNASIC